MNMLRFGDHSLEIDRIVQERKRKAKERGNKVDEDDLDENSPLNEQIMNDNKQDE